MDEVKETQTLCAMVYPWAQSIENPKYRQQFIEWLQFLEWVEMMRYSDIENGILTGEKTNRNEFRLYKQIRESQTGV